MNNLTLVADLLILQSRNQWALATAISELSQWVAQRGSDDVAMHVQQSLAVLDQSLLPLSRGVASLMDAAEREAELLAQTSARPN